MDEKLLFEKVINKIYRKKYAWFKKFIVFSLQPRFRSTTLFLKGAIYVDEDWLGNQWREYHYSTPFPDLNQEDISFADFIGGTLAKNLKNDIIQVYKAVNPKSQIDDTTFTYVRVRTEKETLQEQIKKTLKEELDPTIKLRRLLHKIDNELEYQVRHYYKPHHLCYYKSAKEFFNVVFHAVIEHSYYDYFSDMDDLSKEWRMIYDMMHDYIKEKYGKRLEDYYHINCGD